MWRSLQEASRCSRALPAWSCRGSDWFIITDVLNRVFGFCKSVKQRRFCFSEVSAAVLQRSSLESTKRSCLISTWRCHETDTSVQSRCQNSENVLILVLLGSMFKVAWSAALAPPRLIEKGMEVRRFSLTGCHVEASTSPRWRADSGGGVMDHFCP